MQRTRLEQSKNWSDIENEFIRRSEAEVEDDKRAAIGQIRQWAIAGDWMKRHPEIAKWMRREHTRNNKEKLKTLRLQG